ncbi:methylamine utilization protein [Nonlabens arenilitoris]|uniref:Methylamine utilization protein n=1 Tax=Nonlabens arenilitoris TaxID=1217969 RepID=A0A2S7U832_9FLAO|nr:cytochrome c peroxidase [Nonlabens arenilitoris]PQJ30564.1 methylamine utilization protein [Nonlabens arenilitoris]
MEELKIFLNKTCIIAGLIFLMTSCKQENDYKISKPINQNQVLQDIYINDISECIEYTTQLSSTTERDSLEFYFIKARNSFKKVEPILSFHDINNYNFLNAPNILKVEEEDLTDIKINNPQSFQTLEELIFTDQLDIDSIHKTSTIIASRLELLSKNSDLSHYQPYHILWIVRKQIIRTATTGVTGFDSPVLENSLEDAVIALAKTEQILSLYSSQFKDSTLKDRWKTHFLKARSFLKSTDFNHFNRYEFITEHVDPFLKLWNSTVTEWNVEFPIELAIINEASSLFSKETLSLDYFAKTGELNLNNSKVALGKRLFNDSNLSTSKSISCATCHMEQLAFTDGISKPKGLTRNSPTLTYSAYQQGFFYDKRAGSLEGQIVSVINNSNEFHSDLKSFTKAIESDSSYVNQFKKAYATNINQQTVRKAIADYVRTLNDWDSKWDKNIRDEQNDLTASEINGFNLFNGKAKCATCHFAPVFNGTVPPDYMDTEMEHLGIPETAVITNGHIDPDLGRYDVFKTENRKYFFKTPTIRNIELTAPYMHNGVYQTLEEVVDFYNRGGGYGIGIIDQEYQTLPTEPLNLTQDEMNDIINFMKTLTDSRFID